MRTPAPHPALLEALDVVGDRWTLPVVAALLEGPRRFGDLQSEVPGIASNVLAQRLKRLESQGVLVAAPYTDRPPRFVYELTASGRDLAGALRLLIDWGARHRAGAPVPRHSACGGELRAGWHCATCDRPVRDDEIGELHYA
jgi:DNA-binding HxlR family transcriptional regulator